MLPLLSLIYAPLILFLLKHYPIQAVALGVMVCSVFWLSISVWRRGDKRFPLFYLGVSVVAYSVQSTLVLKLLPLMLALAFTLFLMQSHHKGHSLILHFAKRFSKRPLNALEIAYIERSTLFWVGVSCVNILLHTWMLFMDELYWGLYASIGWYGLFILAGVIQWLHRHYIFLKRTPL